MADQYAIAIEGLAALTSIDELPEKVTRAASMAVNATVRRAHADAGRRMRREVAFPAGYVTGAEGRLKISGFATPVKLEAKITGRRRPTSLARFARGDAKSGGPQKGGVSVEVTPGAAVRLKRAFFIKLRAGAGTVDTKFNLGLAVRLKPGQRPRGSREGAKQIAPGLWLLYGPSVQQVFLNKSGTGVAGDVRPDAADFLEREFFRIMDLDI